MYVITGASGNTGKRIAHQLLAAGKPVTVVGRTAEHLTEFTDKGATAAVGSLEDADFLTTIYTGATAVYALVPPNFVTDDFRAYQTRVVDAHTAALRASGVSFVVTLSSLGAHLSEKNGVIQGMTYLENELDAIDGLNTLHLRAGFFYQNFFSSIGLLKQAGILAGFPIEGDKPLVFVHTNDIADAAVRRLLALDFSGKNVQFVAGPRNLTFNEAAIILGQAIGNPELAWTFFPYDQARAGMLQVGFKPSLADNYIEFCQRVNDGSLLGGFVRNAENTTPTTLEDFAQNEFAPAYQQS
ncbi:NAD(P)H-binding protein [Larkinella sp. VNQ87]|uniref:NAD(P)H-binding protein n=1 Tax=Larkinella sp. VNQ87 TaxID=3400921 RepID=UPI003C04F5D8